MVVENLMDKKGTYRVEAKRSLQPLSKFAVQQAIARWKESR